MKQFLLCLFVISLSLTGNANFKDTTKSKQPEDEAIADLITLMGKLDSTEKTIEYKQGNIKLENGVASLEVPKGFKFINAKQTQYILEELWENLPDASVLGMIVPDSFRVNSLDMPWAFIVSYDALGYVKDQDADKIDYDDLLKDLKEGQEKSNEERRKLGYDEMSLVGWASKPYYDKENKILHWAKEYKVKGSESGTLNYDIRVLGRKGVLSLNAIASIDHLDEVKKNIPAILKMSNFETGYKYEEFDSNVDEVAAWTIGGLVAGKILAKAGFFVVLLKFWKIILIALVAGGGAFWRFITGRRKRDDYSVENLSSGNSDSTAG